MASHYRDAAKCLKAVDGGRTTLKTAAYKTQNPPRTVALVSEVRRHRKALETAIAATGLREKAGGDAQLLLVAVYDAVPAEDRDRTGSRTTRASRESVCERTAGPVDSQCCAPAPPQRTTDRLTLMLISIILTQ